MENLKVTVLEKKGCLTEFSIEIPSDEVKKELEAAFVDIQKNAAIDGFRKGKAPIEFVKREFAKTAYERTIHNLMSSATEQVIKEKKLNPVTSPFADPADFDESKDKALTFKLKIEEMPEFEPKDYKKIKITKKIKKITEKEVENVINNLRDRQSTLEDAGNVAAESHHFLVADYSGIVDGKNMEKPAENQIIDLSHKTLPEGFATGLLGLKAGESKTIETKIADKPAKLDIKVKSVRKKVQPKLDDEFAKDLGHESVDKLKEKIKDELIKSEEDKTRHDLENQLVESLLKSNEFPVPESMVEEEIARMIERTKQYLTKNHGYNDEEFKKSIPAMRDKYKTDAEKTVRVSYLLSRISKDEKIEVSDEEVTKKIEEISAGDQKAKENYIKYRDYLALQLKEEKLFKFLLDNAKIKEVKE